MYFYYVITAFLAATSFITRAKQFIIDWIENIRAQVCDGRKFDEFYELLSLKTSQVQLVAFDADGRFIEQNASSGRKKDEKVPVIFYKAPTHFAF